MKTPVVSTLVAALLLLGCGNAETVSTDTAVTDTVAPEEVAVNEGEAVVTDTSEAEDLTAPTAGSDDENQSKN